MMFYDWSTRKINFVMRLGTSAVMVLLVLGFLFWMYSPRLIGRQILGVSWPKLMSDGNRGLHISVEELEKCPGPIVQMLAGDKSVTVKGKRFVRSGDPKVKPMLVTGPNGRSLLPNVSRWYASEDAALVLLHSTTPNQMSLAWFPPRFTVIDINFGLFRLQYRNGPRISFQ